MQILKREERIDNYGREHVSDVVVAKDIPTAILAKIMVVALNAARGDFDSNDYFVTRPDNYVPYVFDNE